MTRVLSVTSECVPLIKTGGLADVAGALPGALAAEGVEMRTLLPGYPKVMAEVGRRRKVAEWDDLFGGFARVYRGKLGDQVLYALDAPHLFDRDGGPYLDSHGRDYPDNAERFAALERPIPDALAGCFQVDSLWAHQADAINSGTKPSLAEYEQRARRQAVVWFQCGGQAPGSRAGAAASSLVSIVVTL